MIPNTFNEAFDLPDFKAYYKNQFNTSIDEGILSYECEYYQKDTFLQEDSCLQPHTDLVDSGNYCLENPEYG